MNHRSHYAYWGEWPKWVNSPWPECGEWVPAQHVHPCEPVEADTAAVSHLDEKYDTKETW